MRVHVEKGRERAMFDALTIITENSMCFLWPALQTESMMLLFTD